jgi:4-hydroxy-2-oxoheptanedioate aldolase
MPGSFQLAQALRAGETVFLGWVGTPDALVIETIARSKFGAVNLDMQHGWHSPESILNGIRAIVIAGKPAVVRIPVGDFAFASRALDMGAEAIIAPMINTVADAQALVDATKYPPIGKRSWGPGRAMTLAGIASGPEYLAWTREHVLTFAMIETVEAISNLDAILAVPGIDGVFVGPSDLSLTLSQGGLIDSLSPTIHSAVREIRAAAKAKGKLTSMFSANAAHARAIAAEGYQLIAIGTDNQYLTKGCNDLVDAATGSQPSEVRSGY